MRNEAPARVDLAPPTPPGLYQAPGYEWISLACEISAYAPDGDVPLF